MGTICTQVGPEVEERPEAETSAEVEEEEEEELEEIEEEVEEEDEEEEEEEVIAFLSTPVPAVLLSCACFTRIDYEQNTHFGSQ